MLGFNFPASGVVNVPQPGRLFFGDGDGHFVPAPADLFPVDTLHTVTPGKVLFDDFNADGRPDMFVSNFGFDAPPWPGEQNRLYLSRPEGGWRDATASLPQLDDPSHSAAAGDITGRGLVDIFVGNTWANSVALPYFLLNAGTGLFTLTRDNIPGGRNGILDTSTYHIFPASTLADLNGDGLAELIVTGDSSVSFKKLRQSTILWNRAGVFSESDTTALSAPGLSENTRLDHGVQRIDVNQNGLPDLVLAGTRAGYSGWFVQIFVNQANRQFVDETADRVPQGDAFGGTTGEPAPYPSRVQVLDFNQDGAPDFFMAFQRDLPMNTAFPQSLPLVWLNDGTGHFTTLKMGDFIAPGQESLLGVKPRLVATRNGYSFVTLQNFAASGGDRVVELGDRGQSRRVSLGAGRWQPRHLPARWTGSLESCAVTTGKLQPFLVAVSAVALATAWVTAQQPARPRLADYYSEMQWTMVDPGYAPDNIMFTVGEDLNGDGHQDLVVLGAADMNRSGYNVPLERRRMAWEG